MSATDKLRAFMTCPTPILAALVIAGAGAALAIAEPADLGAIPDPTLTPGAIATSDIADICGHVNGLTYTKRHRVWEGQAATMQKYGLPLKDKHLYEDDDVIPVCLGGDNANPDNHWPQLWPEAKVKDRMDAGACRLVCEHKMTVKDAQALFVPDWRVGYCKMYPEDKRC